jgi:hypothetical protein
MSGRKKRQRYSSGWGLPIFLLLIMLCIIGSVVYAAVTDDDGEHENLTDAEVEQAYRDIYDTQDIDPFGARP